MDDFVASDAVHGLLEGRGREWTVVCCVPRYHGRNWSVGWSYCKPFGRGRWVSELDVEPLDACCEEFFPLSTTSCWASADVVRGRGRVDGCGDED